MSDQVAMKKKAPVPIPPFKKADAAAIQALEKGSASEAQQKRALWWIVNMACLTYDFCDKPESERLAAVFDGRRFAGLQIIKLLRVNLAALSEEK